MTRTTAKNRRGNIQGSPRYLISGDHSTALIRKKIGNYPSDPDFSKSAATGHRAAGRVIMEYCRSQAYARFSMTVRLRFLIAVLFICALAGSTIVVADEGM